MRYAIRTLSKTPAFNTELDSPPDVWLRPDPVLFLAAVVLLCAAALAAVWIPAQRATRVDPAAALRCE